MARTYTYADALNFCGQNFSKLVTDSYGSVLADQTNSMIWNAADWRNSIASFAPFYLSPLEQDYGAPTVQVPDMLGLRTAQIVFLPNQPPLTEDLNIERYLQTTTLQGCPADICYEASLKKLRVFPRPPSGMGSTSYMIQGTYKKTPTKVTPDTLATVLPWDDAYFHVFTAGLLYRYFSATANPNAGNVQALKGGSVQYTGQLGAFVAALMDMAAAEALNMGDVTIAPAQSLTSIYSPRLF